jgi:hypothetical protein
MSEESGESVLVNFGVLGLKPVQIPKGYYRVLSGALKPTDLFYAERHRKETGSPWATVNTLSGIFESSNDLIGQVEHYLCVIRKGVPVDAPCARCHSKPVCEQGKLVELCESCYEKMIAK